MAVLFICGTDLTPQEQREVRDFVRKISRKRKRIGAGKISYMLDFGGRKTVSHPGQTGGIQNAG